jgi:hypothetical protein
MSNGNKKHRPYLTNNEVAAIYSWAKEQVRANPDNYIAIDIESAFRKLLSVNVGTQMHTSMPQQQVVNVNNEMEEMYKSFKADPSNLGQSQLLNLWEWQSRRMSSHPFTDDETMIMYNARASKADADLNAIINGNNQDQIANAFAEAGRNTPKTKNPFNL